MLIYYYYLRESINTERKLGNISQGYVGGEGGELKIEMEMKLGIRFFEFSIDKKWILK